MALQLAYRALTDPESILAKQSADEHLNLYRLSWAYYQSKVFAPGDDWTALLSASGLYKHTRLVFNPVPQIIDFYVDNIWSQAGDEKYPKLITPVSNGVDDKLIEAVAQLDQWTNWRKDQQEVKSYAAATGNTLVEVIDDMQRGKVTQKTIWAGYVKGVTLNDAGDVQQYALEYEVYDSKEKKSYKYGKIVTKEEIRYFRDDKPFDYGVGAVIPNAYGFCPAVWFRHSGGGVNGRAAFTDYAKVNHVNSLASHLHDNIHKEIESGKIIFADKPDQFTVISGGNKNSDGTLNEVDPRLDRVLIGMVGQGNIVDMSGLLKLAEAHPYLKDLLLSFGDDYPELEYRQIIKENAQLSGIALERLLTPAQNRLDRAAPNYDGQLIKLRQMQIAIAGWRTRNGWTNLTKQQQLFSPFDLTSYDRGDLDFNLKPSRLIEQTEDEREDLLMKKTNRAVVSADILPRDELLKILGKTDDEIIELLAKLDKQTVSVGNALGRAIDSGQGLELDN